MKVVRGLNRLINWTKIMLSVLMFIFLFTSCSTEKKLVRIEESYTSLNDYFREKASVAEFQASLPELYFKGDEFTERVVQLIDKAADYILIDSFLIFEDEMGKQILQRLKAKLNQGVRVYIITDSASFYADKKSGIPYLHKLGIPYAEYNPIRGRKVIKMVSFLDRDHRKYWIFDGKFAVLGGLNITNKSLYPPQKGGNLDVAMVFKSEEAVEALVGSFVKTWNRYSLSRLGVGDFEVPANADRDIKMWLFNQDPDSRYLISDMIQGLIAFAREEVWMIQPYTVKTKKLIEQVEYLSRKGVRMNLVLSAQGDLNLRFQYASFYGIQDILQAGGSVYVYESPSNSLHNKIFMVDDRWVSLGSANFNFRSEFLSNELNAVTNDARTREAVWKAIGEILQKSRKIEKEEAKKYRGPKYFFYWLLLQLGG